MLEDIQGLPVTTSSPAAIAAINQFIEQALCYGKKGESAVLKGIEADPHCILLQAYAAAHYLSQENAGSRQVAAHHIAVIQRRPHLLTQREELYVQAIVAWADRLIDRAIALHEAIAEQFPRDLISVQQGQYHYFYRGDSIRLLRIAERVLPDNANRPYLYGMLAFGFEQCGELEAAERLGRQAVTLNRYDPWAQHAVAHVLQTQGRVQEGIEWMEEYADTWEICNSMLFTHNWWHVALFYLKQGNFDHVFHLYDRYIWGAARKDSPKDQVGAIATLLRLELESIDVGPRWQEVGGYLSQRLHEHALPFQDLHFIYALERAGYSDWAATMLTSMQIHAKSLALLPRRTWLEIVIPAAEGLVAHAKGDWATAIARLQPVLPQLHGIGGSSTQRQIFDTLYRHALSSSSRHKNFGSSIDLKLVVA